MPRARSPNRDKAKELWLESKKKRLLKDIANELGVSEEQVRKWKSQDKWESGGKVTLPNKAKSNVTKRKRGGQPGNKNACGSHPGAPPGNTNNYRHGFYYDVLAPEEQMFIDAREQISEAQRLLNELDLWEIKERRLLRDLKELRSIPTGLVAHSLTKTKKETTSTVVNAKDYIIHLENLLTQAQRGHMRCIRDLHQIKMDLEKLNLLKKKMGDSDEETLEKLDAILQKIKGV